MNNFFERAASLISIIFLTISIVWWQIFFRLSENADTYFLMNLGRYVLENGFPYIEPFTIHENLTLVAQQWLSGVLFWTAYQSFGVAGLKLIDFLVAMALIVTYWRLCLFVSGDKKFISFTLSFIVALIVSNWIVPRPHIISALFLLLEVFFLEVFTRTKKVKFLLPLPILSVFLINFHAAMWLISLILCLPFFFVKNVCHIKILMVALTAIFLFGLLNPYGLDAMTYVFRSYGIDLINQGVREMMTPSAHDLRGKIFYLSQAFVIFSLTKFKVPWRYILLSGGITFMAIMHGRSLILFYFLATFPLAYVWRSFNLEKFWTSDSQYKHREIFILFFFLLLLINTVMTMTILKSGIGTLSLPLKIFFFSALSFLTYNLLIVKFEGRILHPAILLKKNLSLLAAALMIGSVLSTTLIDYKKASNETYSKAMNFLLKSTRTEDISLYVNQGYGGLAGMKGIKYYIDSRSEVFISANNAHKNILEEYASLRQGKLYYKDFFDRYNFTHIITDSSDYILYNQLIRDKTFQVIYESEHVEGYEVVSCKIFTPKKVN